MLVDKKEILLVLITERDLNSLPDLKSLYSQVNGLHSLAKIPLHLMLDTSIYLKEPQLKSNLWKAICEFFSSINVKNATL